MSKLPVREVRERSVLSPWSKAVLELIQGLVPALTAIITAGWIAYTYFDAQQQARISEEAKSKREDVTRRLEVQKPFNQKQLDLYVETSQVLGRIASADRTAIGKEKWNEDVRRFDALFWSELSMVEDDGVKAAMARFRPYLQGIVQKGSMTELEQYNLQQGAYGVAKALNASIAAAWEVALSEITQQDSKICLAEPSSLCPEGSVKLPCSSDYKKWAEEQKCIKFSTSDRWIGAGGKCGVEILTLSCAKKKS